MRKFLLALCLLLVAIPALATTRFPNGVTNSSSSGLFWNSILPNATSVHSFLDEFDRWNSDSVNYTITVSSSNSTQVMASADMGVLTITNVASATNDATVIEKVGKNFQFETGKRFWFHTRIKVDKISTANLLVGLAVTDTTPFDVTDGVFFQKDAGTTLNFVVRKGSVATATTTNVGVAMADNTYIDLGFYYDGVTTIQLFCSDALVANVSTTYLYTAGALSTIFAVRSNKLANVVLSMDYVYVIKER